jgi:ABC-type methionine transport system ATPase subunit
MWIETRSICQRISVCEIGEILTPTSVDEVGARLKPAQQIMGEIQSSYVRLQEANMKAKALMLRVGDPSLVLQD